VIVATPLGPFTYTLNNLVGGTAQENFVFTYTPPLPAYCVVTYDIVIPAALTGVVTGDSAAQTFTTDLSPRMLDGTWTLSATPVIDSVR